jgi:hypothetical protein
VENEEGTGTRYNLKGTALNDLLPPARPDLLMFPLPHKETPSWEPSIQYMNLWGTFHIQTITPNPINLVNLCSTFKALSEYFTNSKFKMPKM